MKVLLIGGHGTLGRPVARRLAKDGFELRVLARAPEKARALLPGFEVVAGDLADPASLEAALDGCGAVYVSVDTPPKARFRPETEGLRNLVAAARGRFSPRLLVLSALGASTPGAESHPWWHVREKAEAQRIARESPLPWTIFEPTWFLESIPLFIHKKNFIGFRGGDVRAHWIAGEDFGRMVSAALSKNIGQGEVVPVQGTDRLSLTEAAVRFIRAYDPAIRRRTLPMTFLRLAGLFNAQAADLARLFEVSTSREEPAPDPAFWERYAKPLLGPETYADYVRATGDFPQKS